MKLFCWTFMICVVVVSPMFMDLYPFSVFPMFSDNTSNHLFLELTDAKSRRLDPITYGLHKVQLASRDQRYGYDYGPSYFDQHQNLNEQDVRTFLKAYYPDKPYPIVINYRVRGFDESIGKIADIVGPTKIVVDFDSPPKFAAQLQGYGDD